MSNYQLIEGPLGMFLGLDGWTNRRLSYLVSKTMEDIFGEQVKEVDRHDGHPIYKVCPKYSLDEFKY